MGLAFGALFGLIGPIIVLLLFIYIMIWDHNSSRLEYNTKKTHKTPQWLMLLLFIHHCDGDLSLKCKFAG